MIVLSFYEFFLLTFSFTLETNQNLKLLFMFFQEAGQIKKEYIKGWVENLVFKIWLKTKSQIQK